MPTLRRLTIIRLVSNQADTFEPELNNKRTFFQELFLITWWTYEREDDKSSLQEAFLSDTVTLITCCCCADMISLQVCLSAQILTKLLPESQFQFHFSIL